MAEEKLVEIDLDSLIERLLEGILEYTCGID